MLYYVEIWYVCDRNIPTFAHHPLEETDLVATRNQSAVTYWSKILQVAYGSLNPEKCFDTHYNRDRNKVKDT